MNTAENIRSLRFAADLAAFAWEVADDESEEKLQDVYIAAEDAYRAAVDAVSL